MPEIIYDRDFVTIYRGLEPESCLDIVERFEQDERKWRGKVVSSSGNVASQGEIKNSWDLEILDEGGWRNTFQRIHPRIGACLSHYLSRSPVLQSFALEGTGYRIQKYRKSQGYFRWHADAMDRNAGNRQVAMILYLNTVEKGGETEFFHQNLKIAPRAGNLLLFPAGWNYMHCGRTPESSDKYIISTFIRIKT